MLKTANRPDMHFDRNAPSSFLFSYYIWLYWLKVFGKEYPFSAEESAWRFMNVPSGILNGDGSLSFIVD
jgi:hypothetical protein